MGNQLVIINRSSRAAVVRTAPIPMTPARVMRHAKGELRTADILNGVTDLRQTTYVTRIQPGLYITLPLDGSYLVVTYDDPGYGATIPPTHVVYSDWPTLMTGHLQVNDSEPATDDSPSVTVSPLHLTPQQLLSYRTDIYVDTRVIPGPTIPATPAIEPVDIARLLTAVGHHQMRATQEQERVYEQTHAQQPTVDPQQPKQQHKQQRQVRFEIPSHDTMTSSGEFSPFGIPGHVLKDLMITPVM